MDFFRVRRLKRTLSRGLWAQRDFRLFWTAGTVSVVGTAVTRLALPLLATLTLHASALEIGLIIFAEEAPLLVFGLFAGVMIDRRRRLPVMLAMDISRAALMLLVPLAWWQDLLSVPFLVCFAFALGTLTVFFDIASQSFIFTLLEPKDYIEGNAKRYAAESAAIIVGPGLGGALAQAVGPAMTMLLDGVSYVVSFFCLRKITFVEHAPEAEHHEPVLSAIGAGLKEIGRNPYLRTVVTATGIVTLIIDGGWAMLVPYMARELNLGSATIGFAVSVAGFGLLIGTMLVGRVVRRVGLGRALIVGLLGDIPGLLLIAFAFGQPVVAASMVIAGIFMNAIASPIFDINQFVLRQAVTPPELRGRVVASARVAIRGCAAVGALLGGVVAELIGLRGTMMIAALGPILPALILWRSPVFKLRSMPQSHDELFSSSEPAPAII